MKIFPLAKVAKTSKTALWKIAQQYLQYVGSTSVVFKAALSSLKSITYLLIGH